MGTRKRYRKKTGQYVIAVQLNLDTDGLTYNKWGGEQRGKPGDWLVDNQGDFYTVDKLEFEKTYRQKSPGIFIKTSAIWAERAAEDGGVETPEGVSHYQPGDYLVSDHKEGKHKYCVSPEKFESMYELHE